MATDHSDKRNTMVIWSPRFTGTANEMIFLPLIEPLTSGDICFVPVRTTSLSNSVNVLGGKLDRKRRERAELADTIGVDSGDRADARLQRRHTGRMRV